MASKLTKREKQLLDFLSQFILEKGYSPTFKEILSGMYTNSHCAIMHMLNSLEDKNYIVREQGKSRTIRILNYTTV